MSSSFNAIERVDFSSSSRSTAMAPNYGGHDYYRKMLELQDKLRKSEEDRRRLEERFNQLLQESRNRHDACINRLRQRYIEFLEEQREKDERNHKLLGALDRVDGSLALMTAKTGRLNVLRKQYEAYLLRRYASRPPSSIAGDNTIEGGQNSQRYGRRSNVGYSTPPPRQFQELNRSVPYAGVAVNEPPVSSVSYHQASALQNQQIPSIYIDPPLERQDNVPAQSHGLHFPSQANQPFPINESLRLPHEPASRTVSQTSAPVRRPQVAMQTAGNISTHTFEPSTVPREPSSDFRLYSPLSSRLNGYNLDSAPRYSQPPTGLPEQNTPAASSVRFSSGGAAGLNSMNSSHNAKSPTIFVSTTPVAPLSGFPDSLSRFSFADFRNERPQRSSFNAENEADSRYLGIIKRLHRDLDLPEWQAETELDPEQNTSDDILNVTLSEDELDHSAEDKAAVEVKGVKDQLVVSEDVAKVLALADDLASRKPEIEIANDTAKKADDVEAVPDTKQEIGEAAVVPEGQTRDENAFRNDGVAPLPELDDVDERQGGEPVNSADQRKGGLSGDKNVKIVRAPDANLQVETCDLSSLNVEGEEEQTLCSQVEQLEQTKDVHESSESEEKQPAISVEDTGKESSSNEEDSKVVAKDQNLTVNLSEQKHEEYDVAEDLEPWNMDGLTKQIRELQIGDEVSDVNDEEGKDEIADKSNIQVEDPEKPISMENGKTDQPRDDDVQESVSNSTKPAVPEEDATVDDRQVDEARTNDLIDQNEIEDATFRQSAPEDVEEEQKYDERTEYGEQNAENQDASYENQNQGQGQSLDNGQEAQQVEQYGYEQTTGYENGTEQEYQEYAGQNEQYGEYADGQYDEQYANDPNNQYDPNAQYEQNQEYGYEYNQQYGAEEGYENDPNQSYAYPENVSYDQNYENAEKYEQQEYQEDMPPQEEVQNSGVEQIEQESEEKLDVPSMENPKLDAESGNSQPKKKKDVIKSLLDSDTDSTIERNVSNTESDFDFN